LRQPLDGVGTEIEMLEIDEGNAQLRGQHAENLFLGGEPELDEHAPELAPAALLFSQRGLQLRLGNDPLLDEKIADADTLPALNGRCHVPYRCCCRSALLHAFTLMLRSRKRVEPLLHMFEQR